VGPIERRCAITRRGSNAAKGNQRNPMSAVERRAAATSIRSSETRVGSVRAGRAQPSAPARSDRAVIRPDRVDERRGLGTG
jgi:hypothetical protein